MLSRRAVRLALVLALTLASVGIAGGASAAAAVAGTVKLSPATTQVDNGGTFNIVVTSNAAIPISGVSASVTFNKAVLQVTTITRGSAWASAPLFIAGDAPAIAKANSKGVLQNVAASFFPPGNVPAGDQQFITVGFKAIACGTVTMTVPIGRVDSTMLDGRAATYGTTMKVTTTGATVTVCQGGGGASSSPGASDVPSGSIDPNASPSTGPGDSAQPSASTDAGSSPSATAPTPAPSDNGSGSGGGTPGGGTTEQNSWLTFALAALAVSAAGLALLILVLTIVAIIAATVGAAFVFRLWRRYTAADAAAHPPAATADPSASGTTAEGTAETPAATESGSDAAAEPEGTPPAPDPLADAPEPPSGRASASPPTTGK